MIRIIFAGDNSVRYTARLTVAANRHHVGDAYALAAFIPTAFQLVRRHCATP